MAALTAAQNGHIVTLLEKNAQLGKKLCLTGHGRCNLTNSADIEELLSQVIGNPSFLYSAFYTFSNQMLMDFFEAQGVPLKLEDKGRVFPTSNRAEDIVQALEKALLRENVRILLNHTVTGLKVDENNKNRICGVDTTHGFIRANNVIVATGGLTYPSTGSTGDGYRFAKSVGHNITPRHPALVAVKTKENWGLAGLSLRDIGLSVVFHGEKRPVFKGQGELLFTHTGISGPLVFETSRYMAGRYQENPIIFLDLFPALSSNVLADILNAGKSLKNLLSDFLPKSLVTVVLEQAGLPPDKKGLTKAERATLESCIKKLQLTPTGTTGDAIITIGGVDVSEIDPSTMSSKKIQGLYFAGEVLDVDALTGGYNLQIAFSTGYLAGSSVKV